MDEDSWVYSDFLHVVFSMVLSTQEWGSGFGFGSVAGIDPIDVRSWEFISLEIYHSASNWTFVVFGSTKERNLEVLDGHLGAFRVEAVLGQLGNCLEPKACGSL